MTTMAYHPSAGLRPRTIRLDLRYDGSTGYLIASDLMGRDGRSLTHGHRHIHRLAPNAWHGLTTHALIRAVVAAQHDALGLTTHNPDAPAYLYPIDDPGPVTRRRRPDPPTVAPGAGDYHPDVYVAPERLILHALYNGDLALVVDGILHDPDGRPMGVATTYEHDVSPQDWSTRPLAAHVAAAIATHHARLGLNPPGAEHIERHPHLYHTAPDGYPGLSARHPVPACAPVAPVDPDALRMHLVACKERERGAPLPPHLHPTLGAYTPTSTASHVPQMDERLRRDAIIARKMREKEALRGSGI